MKLIFSVRIYCSELDFCIIQMDRVSRREVNIANRIGHLYCQLTHYEKKLTHLKLIK